MKDIQAIMVAVLIVAPVACHDDRPAESPQHGGAGSAGAPAPDNSPAPAPSTTNEPNDVQSPQAPKLNDSPRQSDPTGTAPTSAHDLATPYRVAQPGGGMGGSGGAPFGGTGGSIITSSR